MFTLPALLIAASAAVTPTEPPELRHARKLLHATPLVDTHNDLAWEIREDEIAKGDLERYDLRVRTRGDTDLPRLREGQVGAQFWSVYIPSEGGPRFSSTQLEQIDLARRFIARHPESLQWAEKAADIDAAFRRHRIASFLGIEGGHAIENSLGALRAFYDLGVRYMTLTHFKTLDWADSATDEARHHGLTPFGKAVVLEMNRLGMLVDLSHVSPDVMRQALEVSQAPVIFSHSCALALVDHPRNVPDDVLEKVAARRGVVMVTFVPRFVSTEVSRWEMGLDAAQAKVPPEDKARLQQIEDQWTRDHGPRPRATLAQVADHVEHVRSVAGADSVGLGGDYFGAPPERSVQGLEDVSRYPYLFAELIRRGWSDADLRKLAGRNLVRVFTEAERVAQRLRKTTPPSMARIEQLDGPAQPAAAVTGK
jgi:membrane dipeptidase